METVTSVFNKCAIWKPKQKDNCGGLNKSDPEANIFEYLVTREWQYLRGLRGV